MAKIRTRTTTFLATVVSLILVLAFGNPSYAHWAASHANGSSASDMFLRALALPHWTFSGSDSFRQILAADLTAILVVVFTWVFVLLVGRGPWSGVRGGIGHFLHGWAAYVFAAAFAWLIGDLISSNASFSGAVSAAAIAAGAYGLIVGWIVGLATLASDG